MRARENARPSFARRALACLVSAAMCVAFTPAVAWGEGAASGELDVSQGGITITATGYTIGGGSETAYTGAYTITGTAAQAAGSSSIVVASGTHEITLKDASIDVSKDSDACAFEIAPGASVKLTLAGANSLKSGDNKAALQVEEQEDAAAELLITKGSTGNKPLNRTLATITPPVAQDGLVYDGTPKQLIKTPGSVSDGFTLHYWDGSLWASDAARVTATDAGSYTVDYNVANNSTNVPTGSLQYLHATIAKATPSLGIEASQAKLNGGGTVTLAMSGALAGEEPVVSCDNGIDVSPNGDGTYTAVLPDETNSYTFTASYEDNANKVVARGERLITKADLNAIKLVKGKVIYVKAGSSKSISFKMKKSAAGTRVAYKKGTGAKLVTVSKNGKVLAKKGLKKGRSYTATVKVSCGKATKTVRVTVHVS